MWRVGALLVTVTSCSPVSRPTQVTQSGHGSYEDKYDSLNSFHRRGSLGAAAPRLRPPGCAGQPQRAVRVGCAGRGAGQQRAEAGARVDQVQVRGVRGAAGLPGGQALQVRRWWPAARLCYNI